MRIEIWSDVVCPWCFIGKRRLERALEGFAHRADVEVEYRSFELDPTAPSPATERMDAVLARKYGGGLDNARRMMARVTEVAATEGLEYHLDRTLRGSTVDAHRLLHLALRESGPRAQAALKESLMAAYLTRAEDITDHDVLRRACAAAGLDPDRVDAVLGSQEYAEAIRADVEQARTFGASGVPFFVFDRRYAVSGAQPVEVFTEVLERAWSESHPSLTRVGDAVGDGVDDPAAATAHAPADAAACGPEGCP